jgi:hypothetical protein
MSLRCKLASVILLLEKSDITPRDVREHLATKHIYRNQITSFKLGMIFWPNLTAEGLPASWA